MSNTDKNLDGLQLAISNLARKAGKLDTIMDELSLDGIDYGSVKRLTKELTNAGWTRHNRGDFRVWIAPGETIITAGVSKPGNLRFLIASYLGEILSGIDAISHEELSRMVSDKFRFEGVVLIAIALMEKKNSRKEWYLDKSVQVRTWRRMGDKSQH